MAGSWDHMTGRTGKLLSNENFVGMIENLGDAYEAVEECYGMVWWLAAHTASLFGDKDRAAALEWVRRAEKEYKTGLRIGGVQPER